MANKKKKIDASKLVKIIEAAVAYAIKQGSEPRFVRSALKDFIAGEEFILRSDEYDTEFLKKLLKAL